MAENIDPSASKQQPRRPLPNPDGTFARPNTPLSVVEPANFYSSSSGSGSKPPPLPNRPKGLGSSHTKAITLHDNRTPGYEPPPNYDSRSDSPDYREPELVSTKPYDGEPDYDHRRFAPSSLSSTMGPSSYTNWTHENWRNHDDWVNDSNMTTWGHIWGSDSLEPAPRTVHGVPIADRSLKEEKDWYDRDSKFLTDRMGPGMLPALVCEQLHDPEHTLFSVTAGSPTPRAPHISSTASLSNGALNASPPPPASASPGRSSASPAPSSQPQFTPPTEEEVRTAVPHPDAYYCPKENGWVILQWKSTQEKPPWSRARWLTGMEGYDIPSNKERPKRLNCLDVPEHQRANYTHHYHRSNRKADPLLLTPPYSAEADEWETLEAVKAKRRAGTIISPSVEIVTGEDGKEFEIDVGDGEGNFDIFSCCQCCMYIVASPLIPGVISTELWAKFIKEKRENPPVGKTKEWSIVKGVQTMLNVIENKLWKGEGRMVRIDRASFRERVGWNDTVRAVFERLGFSIEYLDNESTMRPPQTDPSQPSPGSVPRPELDTTPQWLQNRRKLLRAWVEAGAWLKDYIENHWRPTPAELDRTINNKLHITISHAREKYQEAVGAHPSQMPRGHIDDHMQMDFTSQWSELEDEQWEDLGMTRSTFSPDFLIFAYHAQVRCDPFNTFKHFSAFCYLTTPALSDTPAGAFGYTGVTTGPGLGLMYPILQETVVVEQSRARFTLADKDNAASILGFSIPGKPGIIDQEYDAYETEHEFLQAAWHSSVKRAFAASRNPELEGQPTVTDVNLAFKMLAEYSCDPSTRQIWEDEAKKMSVEQAFSILEAPEEVDDGMLLTIADVRIQDQPTAQSRIFDAISVIALIRDSDRLRNYVDKGFDEGEIVPPARQDWPRGLNQLGNTCYLNSLLQYFYTIKELRDAVTLMAKPPPKSFDSESISDDDLKRHRVGGRLVTKREIVRSKQFIAQLADLFLHMEYDENVSVTPTIELAKLALVTSKDEEEEEEPEKAGTDTSNDTDATLVEEGPQRPAPIDLSKDDDEPPPLIPISPSQSKSPGSVLGKRSRHSPQKSKSDSPPPVTDENATPPPETQMTDDETTTTSPPRSTSPPSGGRDVESQARDTDGDVVMRDPSPDKGKAAGPALPPRKPRTDSVMMFGKQHDVAECMDNCMFQIETALVKFDETKGMSDIVDEKRDVVKKLFYGKTKQLLGLPSADEAASSLAAAANTNPEKARKPVEPKIELFSHLLVNVADDGFDLYDGLGRYFDDIVDYEGQKVPMQLAIIEAPPLLQIQLQRVQFDRDTLQSWKSQAYVKFSETIYIDRFMETADPQKRTQSKLIQDQLNTCRERIKILTRSKEGAYPSILEHVTEFIARQQSVDLPFIDDEMIHALGQEQVLVISEIDDLRVKISELKDTLEGLWSGDEDKKHPYELTSVFIHRGTSPSWGHYFFYSRNLPGRPDEWLKYNDSDVSAIGKQEVLADTTGDTANPYLLVFARKGSNVVDAIKRFDISTLSGADDMNLE